VATALTDGIIASFISAPSNRMASRAWHQPVGAYCGNARKICKQLQQYVAQANLHNKKLINNQRERRLRNDQRVTFYDTRTDTAKISNRTEFSQVPEKRSS
jgi:hypothetical protein